MRGMPGKAILAVTVLVALTIAASAQSRPDTRNMTCQQVRALIQDRGAVVLTTGRHLFDRYVSNDFYCRIPHSEAVPATVQTRDGECTVRRCDYPTLPLHRW